ncbi:type II secretion system protein F [Photobacterium carnosum]|uniref:type II secretion system F family protein n=1 Tax=Photobacterium carnosum TaxID=2023717 RepID=UPI001C8FF68C|nr:type II secretion system F family protein [Photobacterium carnosum]MBY3787049.1 type II secretion system protein F [Photobacterium carnosum]MCD9532744.1 type II secretion system protein F [Photobacterium carnosum]
MVIYSILLIIGALILLVASRKKTNLKSHYLQKQSLSNVQALQAINLASLHKTKLWKKALRYLAPAIEMLGHRSGLKISLFIAIMACAGIYINDFLLKIHSFWLPILIPLLACLWGWSWLLKKRKKEFEQHFPDALNIMMSAVTAGESIMQSICYVGRTLDNKVGYEFKDMGEHLKLGEPPIQVFERACKHYPYPAFLFFVVTIRANMSRGGQLKPVMARLIRVLVDSRTLEKKKNSLTSEARLSAKIVGSLPFIFMVIMYYMNPANLEFVFTDPRGHLILYYVVGSEFIGMSIIWLLIRRVK